MASADSSLPSTPRLSKGQLKQQVYSELGLPLHAMLQEVAEAAPLDQVSNSPGSVRWHICHRGQIHKETNTLKHTLLFLIYQTTRHGPQNGFRLCCVHEGYSVGGEGEGEGEGEDDIDILEKPIPQGHMELAILGSPRNPDSDSDAGSTYTSC
ncbi:uncharacterized protein GGS25DRAFT_524118 [Hypoxylon fragiforme]|uniref:uncharacterized protein n=1 Tax=Hypoxylon fragiforme TaxID=63214 RepID=UPI0020C5C293|nr:uncharacterized protein GGS25DRAFT_524118 [Hypoxylon fragiforme]KAI2606452.1 hypothetical protein GGS25DRAFT_524118 [Hypoxylon fragiforme]